MAVYILQGLIFISSNLVMWSDGMLTWPAGCDSYNITYNRHPRVQSMEEKVLSQEACQELCTTMSLCGGFDWKKNKCKLHNFNDAVVSDNWDKHWFAVKGTWFSKNCHYDVGESDLLSCDVYEESERNVSIDFSRWGVMRHGMVSGNLETSQCHRWCTLYAECRSVLVWEGQPGLLACELYNVTVSELVGLGEYETSVRQEHHQHPGMEYVIYDRYCEGAGPYEPAGTDYTPAAVRVDDGVKQVVSGVTYRRRAISPGTRLGGVIETVPDCRSNLECASRCSVSGAGGSPSPCVGFMYNHVQRHCRLLGDTSLLNTYDESHYWQKSTTET